MKILFSMLFALLFTVASQVDVVTDLPNLQEARTGVFLAGQPSPQGLEEMAKHGVRTVVNLRSHDEEGARDESAEAAELQMTYINLPVALPTYTVEKVDEFARIVTDKSKLPVLVHCASANRAAGMWFAFRVLHENIPMEEAASEARNLGLQKQLESVLIDFLSRASSSE